MLKIVDGTDIVCEALNGGPLSNRKSINVPGIKLNMKFISDKDREDIEFGLTQDIDFIAASFTRCAQDVRDIKAILKAHGKEDVEIICKIENMEGVNNIQEILDEANGVMVARGDLGVEVPFEELPEIQKNIIKTCISRGKRVVTATQMLESMAKNAPDPRRGFRRRERSLRRHLRDHAVRRDLGRQVPGRDRLHHEPHRRERRAHHPL